MALSSYAKLLVSVNGGPTQSGDVDVAVGDVVQFTSEDASLDSYRFELYDYPTGFATPAGWSVASDGTIYSLAAVPPPVTIDPWGKYLPRLVGNNDLELKDESTGISAPSPSGLVDIAEFETTQFSSEGWVGDQKTNLRLIAGALGSGDATSLQGADLDAATVGSPNDGDVLTYESASAQWVAQAPVAGGSNADALRGVNLDNATIGTPATGAVVAYDGADYKAALLVDANIDAAAAIAGTKINPDFGSQAIVTTGEISLGAAPAQVGHVRLPRDAGIWARNADDDDDVQIIALDTDALLVGDANNVGVTYSAGSSGNHTFAIGGVGYVEIDEGVINLLGASGDAGLMRDGRPFLASNLDTNCLTGWFFSPPDDTGTTHKCLFVGDHDTPPASVDSSNAGAWLWADATVLTTHRMRVDQLNGNAWPAVAAGGDAGKVFGVSAAATAAYRYVNVNVPVLFSAQNVLNGTSYLSRRDGNGNALTTEIGGGYTAEANDVLVALRGRHETASGTSENLTYTVRVNGVDTGLAVTLNADTAGATAIDTDSIALSTGDVVTVKCTGASGTRAVAAVVDVFVRKRATLDA